MFHPRKKSVKMNLRSSGCFHTPCCCAWVQESGLETESTTADSEYPIKRRLHVHKRKCLPLNSRHYKWHSHSQPKFYKGHCSSPGSYDISCKAKRYTSKRATSSDLQKWHLKRKKSRVKETTSNDASSVTSKGSAHLSVDVSNEMAAVNRDIEALLKKYEKVYKEASTGSRKKNHKSRKTHRSRRGAHSAMGDASGIKLTQKQADILAMDKPPLSKLKEIPIQLLKPRLPPSLKTFHKSNPSDVKKEQDDEKPQSKAELTVKELVKELVSSLGQDKKNILSDTILDFQSSSNSVATQTLLEFDQKYDQIDIGELLQKGSKYLSETLSQTMPNSAEEEGNWQDMLKTKQTGNTGNDNSGEFTWEKPSQPDTSKPKETGDKNISDSGSAENIFQNSTYDDDGSVGCFQSTEEPHFKGVDGNVENPTENQKARDLRKKLDELAKHIEDSEPDKVLAKDFEGLDMFSSPNGELECLKLFNEVGCEDISDAILVTKNFIIEAIKDISLSPGKEQKELQEAETEVKTRKTLDERLCVQLIKRLAEALMDQDISTTLEGNKKASEIAYAEQLKQLRAEHLKHIHREVKHIEDLDRLMNIFK